MTPGSVIPLRRISTCRLRECGRWKWVDIVIRATNNGISAFIGPDGELLVQGPQFEFVALSLRRSAANGSHAICPTGNWPVICSRLIIVLWAGWRAGRS